MLGLPTNPRTTFLLSAPKLCRHEGLPRLLADIGVFASNRHLNWGFLIVTHQLEGFELHVQFTYSLEMGHVLKNTI